MSAIQPERVLPVVAYIGLGGNQGNTEKIFSSACVSLEALPGIEVLRLSPIYRTEPQGLREQPFFLNRVAQLACDPGMQPETLLEMLLTLEAVHGRVRHGGRKDSPRPLDLDLLLFGQEQRNSPHLVLPHPRMLQRAFVLVPLADIAPDLVFPGGMRIQQALNGISFVVKDDQIFQAEPGQPGPVV